MRFWYTLPRCSALALYTCAVTALAAGDPDKAADKGAPKFWPERPDQAQVLAATFLGGRGTDWLVAGGWQPDGTIVIAGNVAGPLLGLPLPERVLGTDGAKPPASKPVPLLNGKGVQEVGKDGQPRWDRLSWRHEGITGFLVRLSEDARQVLSVTRLPWAAGAITSLQVGADGTIYIAGRANDSITALGGDVKELPASAEKDRKGGCDHTFIAKLSADSTKTLWLRHVRGVSNAPQLTWQADGNLKFAAGDLRTISPAGQLVQTVPIPGGMRETASVSPVDGGIVIGGEHHSPTGREPWRCPVLNTYHPDGTLQYQLYDWGGHYVGLDNLRQVSDSAVRFVTHDKAGNILLYAWSDGGNSVMVSPPNDVRSGVGLRGLGMTTAGAGVLSCSYLIRIEPKDFRVIGWTLWLATASGKPNSTWVDALAQTEDGLVCIAGRSAWGLWQTTNKLSEGPPAGEYIGILNPDLGTVRFSSVVPGAGQAQIGNDKGSWGIASGTVRGKKRVLFLSGAKADSEQYGVTIACPTTTNALQPQFTGGESDGYLVLLELPPSAPSSATPPAAAPTVPRLNVTRHATSPKSKEASTPPADAAFAFSPDNPKWETVDAEFRDASGKLWPSFLYGRPISGTCGFQGIQPQASFTVECTNILQPNGEQDRRVLNQLASAAATPKLRFHLESVGPLQTEAVQETDAKGKTQSKQVQFAEGRGTLTLGGQSVAVKPRCVFTLVTAKDKTPSGVRVNAYFTVTGKALGLPSAERQGEISVRVTCAALPVAR